MFTLFTTIVSFLTAGVPKVLDFFQDKGDKKHELEMAQLQLTRELELQKAGFVQQAKIEEIKLDEIQTTTASAEQQALYTHDIEIGKGASQWMVNLRASVRPVISYGMLILLMAVEGFGFYYAVNTGVSYQIAIDSLWSENMQVIFASIIAFHFGTRSFKT
jgi:hypothetical protein